VEPVNEKVTVCENGIMIGIGSKLVIKDECCVDDSNIGLKKLTGNQKFQVDEIEAYQLIIS
jgi:hypothetical protein